MKAVILSAGFGSRIGATVPKSLIRFSNGNCLLDYQLSALKNIMPIHDVYIVVGFKKELIMEYAPQCTYIYNDRFDQTNTAYSLALALLRLNDDCIWMNGDVFLSRGAISKLIAGNRNSLLVNSEPISDEEVCYSLDERGSVKKLRKYLPDGMGESLGVNFVKRESVPELRRQCFSVGVDDYFERGIEKGIEENRLDFGVIDVGDSFVKEMDFSQDFAKIDSYLKGGCDTSFS